MMSERKFIDRIRDNNDLLYHNNAKLSHYYALYLIILRNFLIIMS